MLKKIVNIIAVFLLSSCSFFNNKFVELSVDSNPRGANIYINDQNYGKTPAVLNIEPKDLFITLDKPNYGMTTFKVDTFLGSIRTKANGKINADGVRCLLDLSSVIFFFQAYTGKCADFKEKKHFISIPRNSNTLIDHNYINNYSSQNQQKHGFQPFYSEQNSPQNYINYYYNEDSMKNKNINYQNPYKNIQNY